MKKNLDFIFDFKGEKIDIIEKMTSNSQASRSSGHNDVIFLDSPRV